MTQERYLRFNKIEGMLDRVIDNHSLEDILEIFSIDTATVLTLLYQEGLIDEEVLEDVCGA